MMHQTCNNSFKYFQICHIYEPKFKSRNHSKDMQINLNSISHTALNIISLTLLQYLKNHNKQIQTTTSAAMQDESNQLSSHQYNDRDQDEDFNNQSRLKDIIVVPKSKNKLKACRRCHLLKTEDQWSHDNSCENCGDVRGDIKGHITSKYENVVCILDPTKSWLRKRLGLKIKIVPGSYAVDVLDKY